MSLQAMGDEHWLYWLYALRLQNTGDTFGRNTPLYKYDYPMIEQWLFRIDSLDTRPHLVPMLAANYYSLSQNKADVKYLIPYLREQGLRDPKRKWWWLANAVYLANHKLEDKQWALEMAYELSELDADMPLWTRQMPAFIHEQLGEKESALAIIEAILDSYKREELSEGDLNFMRHFIEERLEFLQQWPAEKYPEIKSPAELDAEMEARHKANREKAMQEAPRNASSSDAPSDALGQENGALGNAANQPGE